MKRLRLTGFVLLFAAVLSVQTAAVFGQAAPSATDLVTNLSAYFESPSFVQRGTVEIAIKSADELIPAEQYRFEFRQADDGRFDVISDHARQDKGAFTPDRRSRMLSDGKQLFQYQQQISPENRPGSLRIITSSSAVRLPTVRQEPSSASFLRGILPGDMRNLCDILATAENPSVAAEMESVDGAKCWVLSATAREGQYQIWIDPAAHYALRKAHVARRAGDLYNGRPLATAAGVTRNEPLEITGDLDHIQLDPQSGRFFPTAGTWSTKTMLGNGSPTEQRYAASGLTNNFSPDWKAISAFEMNDVPNGTTGSDSQGGSFVWKDGKAVPTTADPAVRAITQQELEQMRARQQALINANSAAMRSGNIALDRAGLPRSPAPTPSGSNLIVFMWTVSGITVCGWIVSRLWSRRAA